MAVSVTPAAVPSGSSTHDGILPTTRWLALFIIPFLVVAAVILWLWPEQTGKLFAWPIQPRLTAMLLATAYIGGIYFFARVARSPQWHRIKVGFWPVGGDLRIAARRRHGAALGPFQPWPRGVLDLGSALLRRSSSGAGHLAVQPPPRSA
jgi:hypothetical protein